LKTKKILLLTSEFPPDPGGIGNHAYNLARAFREEGYLVHVITDVIDYDKKKLSEFADQQIFTINWIKRRKPVAFTYLFRAIKYARAAMSHDIIICSGKFAVWMMHAMMLVAPSKKYLIVAHGNEVNLPSKFGKKLVDSALKKADALVAVSKYTSSYIADFQKTKRVDTVIPNGIHVSEFQKKMPGKSFDLVGSPKLLTLGSLSDRKGQANVINALNEIKKSFPDVHYHCVGNPYIKDQLLKLAADQGLQAHVTLHGMRTREEVMLALKACDVKLMLSQNTPDGDFEGFGIAVLEANAYGKPSIGSEKSGIEDAIDNHKTGVLVDHTNKLDIAKALQEVMKNYTQYSANASEWANQHDWKNIVKKYVSVIKVL
jgi:phosphatidyl-myo-inositol dimannoside synthase